MPSAQYQNQQLEANLVQNQVIQEKIELFDQCTNSTISQKSGGSRDGEGENVLLSHQFFEPNDPLK